MPDPNTHTAAQPAAVVRFPAVLAVRVFRISLLTSGAKRARTADLLHAHAALIYRSTSGVVQTGSLHLYQCSDVVGHSLSQPGHGGSRDWLPGTRAAEEPPMTTERNNDLTPLRAGPPEAGLTGQADQDHHRPGRSSRRRGGRCHLLPARLQLVTSHGETGLTARLLPVTVDGLIPPARSSSTPAAATSPYHPWHAGAWAPASATTPVSMYVAGLPCSPGSNLPAARTRLIRGLRGQHVRTGGAVAAETAWMLFGQFAITGGRAYWASPRRQAPSVVVVGLAQDGRGPSPRPEIFQRPVSGGSSRS